MYIVQMVVGLQPVGYNMIATIKIKNVGKTTVRYFDSIADIIYDIKPNQTNWVKYSGLEFVEGDSLPDYPTLIIVKK